MSRSGRKASLGACTAAALLFLAEVYAGVLDSKAVKVRLGLSDDLFNQLNQNDARAAVRAWAETVASGSHLEMDRPPLLLRPEEIVHAIATHQVDGFSITALEYAKVAQFVAPTIFIDDVYGKAGVEYLLLVGEDSGIRDLAGLRGRSLLVNNTVSMCLAPAWLETLLAAAKLDSADVFLGRITKAENVSKSVLPVFFGHADACLVTRANFETMSELNPQLLQKLHAIAVSPKLRAVIVGLHKDSSDEIKSRFGEALLRLSETPSGRQILMLFQTNRLIAADTSMMRASVDLLAAYDRLKSRRTGAIR